MQVGGLLSADPAINPRYYNHSLVFVHYCDGSSMSSNATNPIPTAPGAAVSQIWMRGRPNLAAVLSYLMSAAGGSMGSSPGTEVILSGGSAGGTAAFLSLDWVASYLPSTVKLVGAPDGGCRLHLLPSPDAPPPVRSRSPKPRPRAARSRLLH